MDELKAYKVPADEYDKENFLEHLRKKGFFIESPSLNPRHIRPTKKSSIYIGLLFDSNRPYIEEKSSYLILDSNKKINNKKISERTSELQKIAENFKFPPIL